MMTPSFSNNTALTSSSTHQSPTTDRSRFTFQHPWFEEVRHEWEDRTASLRGKPLRILEIGCFEGASTTWILDNLVDHPDSRMTAIDHFGGGMEHKEGDASVENYDLSDLEARFRENVSKCKNVDKLRLLKQDSQTALLELLREGARFDFIYIDGSHIALDVLQDAVLSWQMLNIGGTMVFDDWNWKGYMQDCYNPRIAIISFLRCAKPEIEWKKMVSQVWVTRVKNNLQATKNPDPEMLYPVDYLKDFLSDKEEAKSGSNSCG